MYVLAVTLMFMTANGPQFMSPPALPLFFTEESCKSAMEPLTDALKLETKADKIIYNCTRVFPVNNGAPA